MPIRGTQIVDDNLGDLIVADMVSGRLKPASQADYVTLPSTSGRLDLEAISASDASITVARVNDPIPVGLGTETASPYQGLLYFIGWLGQDGSATPSASSFGYLRTPAVPPFRCAIAQRDSQTTLYSADIAPWDYFLMDSKFFDRPTSDPVSAEYAFRVRRAGLYLMGYEVTYIAQSPSSYTVPGVETYISIASAATNQTDHTMVHIGPNVGDVATSVWMGLQTISSPDVWVGLQHRHWDLAPASNLNSGRNSIVQATLWVQAIALFT